MTVTITGVLTTSLGALEARRGGFIQDASGAIALYLDAPVSGTWPAGTRVTVKGSLDSRYAQRTLRVAEASFQVGPAVGLPIALALETGTAGEWVGGTRIEVTGTIAGRPVQLADGLGVTLDDGSGPILVVIGPNALAERRALPGMIAVVVGPLGQRDNSGTGAKGYRIHAMQAGDLELFLPTSVSPTATPKPTASPSRGPSPSVWPSATPAPRPEMIQAVGLVRTDGASNPVLPRRVARAATRVIALISSIAAIVLGSGDLIITAGLFGGFIVLALLAHRELRWPDADHLSPAIIALIAALLVVTWAFQLGSIPLPNELNTLVVTAPAV